VEAGIRIHYPLYHQLTPTNIDHTIVFPLTLNVDANDYALTTVDQVLNNYDVHTSDTCEIDYVIYSKVPTSCMFSEQHDWCYKTIRVPQTGELKLVDSHLQDNQPLTGSPIINPTKLMDYLSSNSQHGTRFAHYKQAYTFLKHSFPVGDTYPTKKPNGQNVMCQVSAVYLDAVTGESVPYMTSDTHAITGQEINILYKIASINTTSSAAWTGNIYDSVLQQTYPTDLSLISPPDPNHLTHGPLLVKQKDSQAILVRNVPQGRPIMYTLEDNFEFYDETALTLLLYYVMTPLSPEDQHQGEELYICYSSSNTNALPVAVPKRDPMSMARHPNLRKLSTQFTLKDNEPPIQPGQVYAPDTAPRLHYPISFFSIKSKESPAPINLPFQYESLNNFKSAKYNSSPDKRNLGVRLMQLVCEYLFEKSTDAPLQLIVS
jgi:hypothetical protein